MANSTKSKLLDAPGLNSRIHSANTQKSEMWLGYFAGPAMMYITYYCIAGSYLNQFYTDVLGLAGTFLTLMPALCKMIDAITNIVMGRIIDRTRTRQGKARPWILLSGILVAVSGILLYTVPSASYAVQIVWIVFSYNLFFSFAFTIYNMSHTLMVPLSTRNTKQRDTLALLSSTGMSMIPGFLVTIIMPIMISAFGVGGNAQSAWIKMMSILSIIAIPAALVEYYFTRERVTEEAMDKSGKSTEESIPFRDQIKACFTNRYWLIIMAFFVVYNIANTLSTNSLLYFCNWVLGNSVESGTGLQITLNIIGQAPLGLGVIILWPLVRKFGKRKVSIAGFVIGILGCGVCLLNPSSLTTMLAGLCIKAFGMLPTYVFMAHLAEALDHIEWKNHYRADGFSASVYSIILTVSAGIGSSILLGGISAFGYIAPSSSTEIITQPAAMQNFFIFCYIGSFAIAFLVGIIAMIFFDVEKLVPTMSADITARHKAEAEARGEVYYSAEEKAAMEQEAQERIAEQKRIEELKAKCAKKGLDFDTEESKYQAKLAQQKEKAARKRAKQ
ncbi:MAG: MFS transporter [Faecousia sp.]